MQNFELTTRESPNRPKRKNSFLSKKTTIFKENQQQESEDRSKLNISVMKSENNYNTNIKKEILKSEKTVTLVIPEEKNLFINKNNNNNIYSNLDKENQKEASPIRRKISNLKLGSNMKNSNLFLTNIAEIKQQNENYLIIESFNILVNNNFNNNKVVVNETKQSSVNLLNLSQEDISIQGFKITKEEKIAKKHQPVLFDLKEDKKEKVNYDNKTSIKNSKHASLNNATKDPHLNESFDFENKQNSFIKKIQIIDSNSNNNNFNNKKQNNKEKEKSWISNNSNNQNKWIKNLKLKNNKELNLGSNFESKKTLIHLSFSDSESNSSFMNFNYKDLNKNNNNLLMKGKLPPLRISNLENQNDNVRSMEIKGKSRHLSESLNKNASKIEKMNKEKTIAYNNNNFDYYAINENYRSPNKLNIKDSSCKLQNDSNGDENKKESFSPKSKAKANTNGIFLNQNKQNNIYNLKLPKLVLHQKNKSHLDILHTITKELRTVGNHSNIPIKRYESENNNNKIYKQIFPKINLIIQPEKHQNFKEEAESEDYNLTENENENENEFYTTSENNLKLINSHRIKPKRLPLELDKPKQNNSKQGLKSQLFLKGFFSKCKNQQKNISTLLNDISSNVKNNANEILINKKDPIQFGIKTILDIQSEEIDKEIFHLDYPLGIRENAVGLKGPPLEGENKYLFDNKNSPMVIGEVISKLHEGFAVRCKEVLKSRFILKDEETKKRIHFAKEKKELDKHILKISTVHKQIEMQCEKMEKVKFSAMKDFIEY